MEDNESNENLNNLSDVELLREIYGDIIVNHHLKKQGFFGIDENELRIVRIVP